MKKEQQIVYKRARVAPWQERLLLQLNEQRQHVHLPHGIILHTDQSSDLTSFLWHLASDLVCSNDSTTLHCGECPICELMASNSFSDVFWVTKEYDEKKKKVNRDINIVQIRELIHQLSLTNRYNTLKVAIIYPAEFLNISAANALLKTLEEPEPDTILILVTHKLGKLPITIRSRCQHYKIPQATKEQSLIWCSEQGVDETEVNTFLQKGITDPVTMCHLAQEDYLDAQVHCETRMLAFIGRQSQHDVAAITADLMAVSLPVMRLIVNGFIDKLIQFHVDAFNHADLYKVFKSPQKHYAQKLYKIRHTVQQQLLFEENNLNVQLQINDVLLSLKNVFKTR